MQHKFTLPHPGSISRYSDFAGSSNALFFAQLARQTRPVTIITANALNAQQLLEEIPFFAPELQ
ncbi:MAG TPA: hypothetical protein DEF07_00800, partial [Nitrosomonas sp.]|nr:hypothetical protein [Nitrosomonas sp.]